MGDEVNHPPHYTNHPSGVECIEITEQFSFCRGNAIKYLWRAGEKGDILVDLRKARWYVDREIARLEKCAEEPKQVEATGYHIESRSGANTEKEDKNGKKD